MRYVRVLTFYFFCLIDCSWAGLPQETVFLTWKQSPSTTMVIQWVSLNQEKQSTVSYCQKTNNNQWIQIEGEFLEFPQSDQYLIHRVELKNLQPNTEYLFRILAYPQEYQFLTASCSLRHTLSFVVGGDMYHDEISQLAKMCQIAAQTSPMFALVGGDIAYAVKSRHSKSAQIERWIEWIKNWHSQMVTPQGHLIPVLASIGNHDLIGQYAQTPIHASIFSALFPMPGDRIYNVLDFDSYLSIFILDSGHANSIEGKQTRWLEQNLKERKGTLHRLALYHVPAYPSVRNLQNPYSSAVRCFWTPVFEKGGIQAAFEHHDHAYKRTYPLLRGGAHPQGVVYLGDGCWGVKKPRRPQKGRAYLAKTCSAQHVIVVTLTPFLQTFTCINNQGKILDKYSRPVSRSNKVKGLKY